MRKPTKKEVPTLGQEPAELTAAQELAIAWAAYQSIDKGIYDHGGRCPLCASGVPVACYTGDLLRETRQKLRDRQAELQDAMGAKVSL